MQVAAMQLSGLLTSLPSSAFHSLSLTAGSPDEAAEDNDPPLPASSTTGGSAWGI